MNALKAKVKVNWIPSEQGGRVALPDTEKYSTVSKFKEDDWKEVIWSVVLEFAQSPKSQGNLSIGECYFLNDEAAPHERLYLGNEFELYEGQKKVAFVQIISDPVPR